MNRWIQISLVCALALVVACGPPRRKGGGAEKDDTPSFCTAEDCEDNNGETASNNACGVASCDDSNACTVDSGEQDQSTCTTSCTYTLVDECVSDDGCCPAGCTVDDDSDCADPANDPSCTTECPAQQDECLEVAATTDADGCITACDYSPMPGCGDGNNATANNASPNNASPNNASPNNTTPNNTSLNNATANNANNMTCVPKTCTELGAVCGTLPDACGGTVTCGTCSGDEECTADGRCEPTGDECDPNVAGTCPDATPYCLDGTCRECVGVADCNDGELCSDGFCTTSPDCTVDPSVCPDGYDCIAGTCEAPVGDTCDPNDPNSCADGLFCDPSTGTCTAAGGELGCGLCSADCTCPGQLTCDGYFCSGCSSVDEALACPEGQLCLDLFGTPICMPFSG